MCSDSRTFCVILTDLLLFDTKLKLLLVTVQNKENGEVSNASTHDALPLEVENEITSDTQVAQGTAESFHGMKRRCQELEERIKEQEMVIQYLPCHLAHNEGM